jgi:hypothetical protein
MRHPRPLFEFVQSIAHTVHEMSTEELYHRFTGRPSNGEANRPGPQRKAVIRVHMPGAAATFGQHGGTGGTRHGSPCGDLRGRATVMKAGPVERPIASCPAHLDHVAA